MVREFAGKMERAISGAENIVIVGHFNPDGDSVGSVTGMYYYLKELGKKAVVVLPSSYPEYLSFLDKDKDYLIFTKNPEKVAQAIEESDLIIGLDFNNLGRTEGVKNLFAASSAISVVKPLTTTFFNDHVWLIS